MSKVLLGMNGGVDSSVSAWLLKRDAHDVVGVTLRFHDLPSDTFAVNESARICQMLGIQHVVVDAREQFSQEVELPVAKAFMAGANPNADSLCAQKVLFPLLFQQMLHQECDFMATGHFANVEMSTDGVGLKSVRLHMPLDRHKDQSYLLYAVDADILARTKFPLHDTTKLKVRENAMRAGFVKLAPLEDSRGWCYRESGEYLSYLAARKLVTMAPGQIKSINGGKVLGAHVGLCRYRTGQVLPATVGQAAGLTVIAKDMEANCLYVGPQNLSVTENIYLKDFVWTSSEPFRDVRSCRIRLEQTGPCIPCQAVVQKDGKVMVNFTQPRAGLSSGHIAVFYSDTLALGGGILV